jgi:hypothetical protein
MASLAPVVRRFTRARLFTAIAVITLAIGIGANTAVFSVVNGVLIKPLPYPNSEELVGVWHSAPGAGFKEGVLTASPTMLFTYREEGRVFQEFGLWSDGGVTVTGLAEPEQVRGNFSYQALGRLKPGVTVQHANADVARLIPIWLNAWPAPMGLDRKVFENAGIAPAVRALKQDVVGNVSEVLWVLMGTIGVVLLIACANVANLFLVRVEGRQQELATRAALGAGWGRIARELLQESVLLGLVGGVVGVAVAVGSLRVLRALRPDTLPRLDEITIDPVVLGFALLASLLSGLLFGIIPVLKYRGPASLLRYTAAAPRATAASGTVPETSWLSSRWRWRWCCSSRPD